MTTAWVGSAGRFGLLDRDERCNVVECICLCKSPPVKSHGGLRLEVTFVSAGRAEVEAQG